MQGTSFQIKDERKNSVIFNTDDELRDFHPRLDKQITSNYFKDSTNSMINYLYNPNPLKSSYHPISLLILKTISLLLLHYPCPCCHQ